MKSTNPRLPAHIPFVYLKGRIDLFHENITGKKVLVLGSGPSARDVDWRSVGWDALVTTSFFYLNDEVISKKPVHVSLSKLVDLSNERLLAYLDSNPKCTISFEPKIDRFGSNKELPNDQEDLLSLVRRVHAFYNSGAFLSFFKKYGDRMIFYRVPGGKEGLAGRLCWLTMNSEPEKIYICGIDGVSKDRDKDPRNYFRDHTGTTDSYSYEDYLNSFESFAERLYTASGIADLEIVNLGKGKPYNMMTDVSEKYELRHS